MVGWCQPSNKLLAKRSLMSLIQKTLSSPLTECCRLIIIEMCISSRQFSFFLAPSPHRHHLHPDSDKCTHAYGTGANEGPLKPGARSDPDLKLQDTGEVFEKRVLIFCHMLHFLNSARAQTKRSTTLSVFKYRRYLLTAVIR